MRHVLNNPIKRNLAVSNLHLLFISTLAIFKDLAERTSLSTRTISELYNNKIKSYTKHSIDELVNVFGITDMIELIMIVDDEETDN